MTTWVPVPQPPGARLLILQGPFFYRLSAGFLSCSVFILGFLIMQALHLADSLSCRLTILQNLFSSRLFILKALCPAGSLSYMQARYLPLYGMWRGGVEWGSGRGEIEPISKPKMLSTVFCNLEQVAYYARKRGEFRDVMSRLEEMARLGAKVKLET